MIRAADELASRYELDRLALKESLLSKVDPAAKAEDQKRLAETLLELSREAAELDQFDVAARSAQAALAAAKKAKDVRWRCGWTPR